MIKSLTTIFATLAISSTLTFAADETKDVKPEGEKRRGNPEEAFKKIDTNSDSGITLEEFKASPRGQKDPAKAEQMFGRRDTNKDGKLDLEEFKARPAKKDKAA